MLLPPLRPFDYDCFCALQARAWVSGPYPLTILADSVGKRSGLILTTTFLCSQSFLRSHTCPFVARYVRFSCCPPALLRRPQMCWGTCIDEYMACGSAPYLNTSKLYLLLLDTLATYLQLCTAHDADMWMLLLPIDRQTSCLLGPSNIGSCVAKPQVPPILWFYLSQLSSWASGSACVCPSSLAAGDDPQTMDSDWPITERCS